ncbi:FumA C-terminus/TtdB family hydratase beta subunit [Chloroflexota bacterium]
MKITKLNYPLSKVDIRKLRIGDTVYLNGIVYITRDLGHKRIVDCIQQGKELPVSLEGAAIYHAGPVVNKKNDEWDIVNCGPTSSARMNPYSPAVIKAGVRALIGKGSMDDATLRAMKTHGAVFLAAYSLANIQVQHFEQVLGVHWLDLSTTEAIWVVRVKDWGPLIVAMDSHGNNLYSEITQRARERLTELPTLLSPQ